jgi:hypothetical protein
MDNIFTHCGGKKEIIYSLPVVKAMGGGTFLFGVNKEDENPLTRKNSRFIKEIVALQDYIVKADFYKSGDNYGHDFNLCRNHNKYHKQHISYTHMEAINQNLDLKLDLPWFQMFPHQVSEIVITRTQKNSKVDANFDWSILEPYKYRTVFMGNDEEWEEFKNVAPWVERYEVRHDVEFAGIIAGSKFFIGDGFGFALAEAIKIPRCLELRYNEDGTINCPIYFPQSNNGYTELSHKVIEKHLNEEHKNKFSDWVISR